MLFREVIQVVVDADESGVDGCDAVKGPFHFGGIGLQSDKGVGRGIPIQEPGFQGLFVDEVKAVEYPENDILWSAKPVSPCFLVFIGEERLEFGKHFSVVELGDMGRQQAA